MIRKKIVPCKLEERERKAISKMEIFETKEGKKSFKEEERRATSDETKN